jgi:6-phosphogluconate dehydrogenase
MGSQLADIGLIGLAVMGENLVLNMANHGFTVCCYNRTTSKVDEFLNGRAKGKSIIGAHSVKELCSKLKKPRRVMLMVRAGEAVDSFIEQLLPHMEPGDIIIDGGNSNYQDTTRRVKALSAKGFHFVGTGVSGGEEGALNGPSIMPGGSKEAWPHIKDIFQKIAAKVEDGSPCCDWVGEEGAGHFVKMVHNGIEYGDMQLIAEAYFLLKNLLGMSNEELAHTFAEWNKGDLDSYLIEITSHIFTKKDDIQKDKYVVDLILDEAGQKGTGKWTVEAALDMGMPVTLIGEAVFARCLSSMKEERVKASKILSGPKVHFTGDRKQFVDDVRDAIFASKIVSYAQGYILMRAAAREYKWNLNYGGIALMWRGGCIIRSKFLGNIKDAYTKQPNLENLLFDPYFVKKVTDAQNGWRRVAATAMTNGLPIPAISTALNYYDGLRSAQLPANLIQAQRDYFGAHTYERIDMPGKGPFHTNWTGHGGTTASTAYNVLKLAKNTKTRRKHPKKTTHTTKSERVVQKTTTTKENKLK